MILKRQNVLELIGSDRRKYHSCLLTSYSFDFSYFEERVLPILRTSNIKNVNVLVDGKQLEQTLEHTTGKEFKQHKTYSIQPIYAEGVFHPKILLLTGTKHGLFIIGSGNITSSGMSCNDEIWGAFHMDNIENENAPLFGMVWRYLSHFTETLKGFNNHKIEWIRKYSPWVSEIVNNHIAKAVDINGLGINVTLLSNLKNESIYRSIIEQLPTNSRPDSITIISPYYDKDGRLIAELDNHYNPKSLYCIVDENDGLLPTEIRRGLKERVTFHKWSDCKEDFKATDNRLHAKLFHFQYSKGIEYLLIGSANASIAAWGGKDSNPINTEVGLLIKRVSDSNYLSELGIKIPNTKGLEIDTIPTSGRIIEEATGHSPKKIRAEYAELEEVKLTIFATGQMSKAANIIVQSEDSEITETISIDSPTEEIIVRCSYPNDLFKIHITDSKGNRVSNYCLVHRIEFQAKCNPDPEQEKLNSLLDADNYVDNEGLSDLVAYVDYNWADENENSVVSQSASTKKIRAVPETEVKSYEILSADKFNKVSQEVMLKQSGELSSASVRIAEFLHMIGHNLKLVSSEQFEESEELKLFQDEAQRGEGNESYKRKRAMPSAKKEIRSIKNFFKKLNKQLTNQLEKLRESKSLSAAPDRKLTIKNLSNMLIALSLVHLYFGKKYMEEEESIQAKEYLEEGDLYSGGVKLTMVELLGKFLLLATAGFKDYEYELLNNKAIELRNQFLHKGLFTILNLSWNQNEIDYRDNLLLNIHHFIPHNSKITETELFVNNLRKELSKFESSAKRISRSYENNKSELFRTLIPSFSKWQKLYEADRSKVTVEITEVTIGAMIFNSKLGFNTIYKKSLYRSANLLTLKRPGYEWTNEMKDYLLDDIVFGAKCILFR
jgi:hypothetical protein